MSEEKRVTFYLKNTVTCPVCEGTHKKEELFTGRGRLIAGNLTDELRRDYEASQKYGKITPLIYPITVCPDCYFATLHDDFTKISPKLLEQAKASTKERKQVAHVVFGKDLDFMQPRTMKSGTCSYLLAISSYSYFEKNRSPTIKKGLMSVRLAWLLGDLAVENSQTVYGYMQNLFYEKGLRFLQDALDKATRGQEPFDGLKYFGPDTDNDFGYDGIIYLVGVLRYKLGWKEQNIEKRFANYEETKRLISRLYGMGKATKDKPGAILTKTMDLYEELSGILKELGAIIEKNKENTSVEAPS